MRSYCKLEKNVMCSLQQLAPWTGGPSSARPRSPAPPRRRSTRLLIYQPPAPCPPPCWTPGTCTSSPPTCVTHIYLVGFHVQQCISCNCTKNSCTWCWYTAMNHHTERGPVAWSHQSTPRVSQMATQRRQELCHFLFPLRRCHHWWQRTQAIKLKWQFMFNIFIFAIILF